jgi:hypothetical protein
MKKFIFVLIMGALLTVNVIGQANLSFTYQGTEYFYADLDEIEFENLGEHYNVLKSSGSGKLYVVEIDGKLYMVVYK